MGRKALLVLIIRLIQAHILQCAPVHLSRSFFVFVFCFFQAITKRKSLSNRLCKTPLCTFHGYTLCLLLLLFLAIIKSKSF